MQCQAARKWESNSSDDGAALDFSEQPDGASTADDSDGGAVRAAAPTADLTLKSRVDVDEDEDDEEEDEEDEEGAADAGAGQVATAAGAHLARRGHRECVHDDAGPYSLAFQILPLSMCGLVAVGVAKGGADALELKPHSVCFIRLHTLALTLSPNPNPCYCRRSQAQGGRRAAGRVRAQPGREHGGHRGADARRH